MDLLLPIFQSSIVTKAIGPAFVVVLIFWFRSGSIYTLLDRTWRIFAGKGEISSPRLQEFIHETRNIEKFRFMFGIKVRSIDDINRVIKWLNRYSIDIILAQRARRWIDLSKKDLIIDPPAGYLGVRWGLVVCVMIPLAFLPSIFLSKYTLLQMKESKVWFLSDAKKMSQVRGRWTITSSDCNKNFDHLEDITGFKNSEVKAACAAFDTDELNKLVKESIRQQRGLAAGCGAFFLYIVFILFFRIISFNAAEEIIGLIKRKSDLEVEAADQNRYEAKPPVIPGG